MVKYQSWCRYAKMVVTRTGDSELGETWMMVQLHQESKLEFIYLKLYILTQILVLGDILGLSISENVI